MDKKLFIDIVNDTLLSCNVLKIKDIEIEKNKVKVKYISKDKTEWQINSNLSEFIKE